MFYSQNGRQDGMPGKFSIFQVFILFLMKLRLRLFNRDLAPTVVSEIFITWMRFLRLDLEVLIQLPPRAVIEEHMPSLFKQFYPKTAFIIDCTEIETERLSALNNQPASYSSFTSRTTMKALYPGSISGKQIIIKIGPLDHLQPNDEVMADMGFLIQDEPLASVGATLTIPAFLSGRKQFSKEDTATNEKVDCF